MFGPPSFREKQSAHEIKERWTTLFQGKPIGHPFWMHVHIPFCPQSCSYCQCSRTELRNQHELNDYLDWLEGEIDFFEGAMLRGKVRFQYIGGGTPNILNHSQLSRLFGLLNKRFSYEENARRSFELLPSALRPGTLELIRSYGFNRLSLGVQSANDSDLIQLRRKPFNLEYIGGIVNESLELGFDEINLDLIWDSEQSNEKVVSAINCCIELNPTTITLHNLIPTSTNPIFDNVEAEIISHKRFRTLDKTIGSDLGPLSEQYVWVYRPDSWAIVKKSFYESGKFSLWYYSDVERLHIDMLGLGKFAHSRILGETTYEALPSATKQFDPDETSYSLFRTGPLVDSTIDLLTDLVGSRKSNLCEIENRYSMPLQDHLLPVLRELEREGVVREEEDTWHYQSDEHVFLDPLEPLLEVLLTETAAKNAEFFNIPQTKKRNSVTVELGASYIDLTLEKLDPEREYYSKVGSYGIFYSKPVVGEPPTEKQIEEAMTVAKHSINSYLQREPQATSSELLKALETNFQKLYNSPS